MLKLMTAIALTVLYHETGCAVSCSREAFAAWAFGDDWDQRFIGWTDVVYLDSQHGAY